jgi:uncharacterized protein DUF2017
VSPARGVVALADGGYAVGLEPEERELLLGLAAELEQLVASDDAAVARLFPPAHRDDEPAEREYRALMRESLAAGRLQTLGVLRATVDSERLTHEEADAWCVALNDLRLVLGARLELTEELLERIDPRHPQAAELAVYGWLTWLQAMVVDALASRL